ncbi:Eco57I restriction-modification methylase domain-containing protein [Vibrio cyclitrophicus]|uniref:Eco57I restriction-modification methylase domain-containing protein n=1 Tax=Vibrio cyclitrophicus TaxID=47951 RepID=UPI000C85A188|nr:N-6 DNA methylase [Vibrio cyclitrophicus]PMJ75535.1 modification methylase [Vibrio cyclitrophicus]
MKFKENQTKQKLRGGYYTPLVLADFITNWVSQIKPNTVLEPSCGDGVFIQALHNNGFRPKSFVAIERDEHEAHLAANRALKNDLDDIVDVKNEDFLEWAINTNHGCNFDAIVGNPPFIRYQFLEDDDQEYAKEIFEQHELKFTKHTNAWVPFVISSISMLRPGGRLGMVIPSEIFHVLHAASLRKFLLDQCSKIVIFDPQDIWFEGTLQGAVIIFAEKKRNPNDSCDGIGIHRTRGMDFTSRDPEGLFSNVALVPPSLLQEKWTLSFLSESSRHIIKKLISSKYVKKFDDVASVAVGIVTGANDYFLVNDDIVRQYGLEDFAYPMFGRSNHCKGVVYDERQHIENVGNNLPSNFIYIPQAKSELSKKVSEYIKLGETKEYHKRYKCRIREPWYTVPSVYSTRLGMLKRSHHIPKVIFNEKEAYTTDTAYRMTLKCNDISEEQFTYCFINPLTAIFSELEGRHYGGGVLELVPSEIRRLYVPLPDLDFDLDKLNNDIINAKNVDDVLIEHGSRVLKAIPDLVINDDEVNTLIEAWRLLRLRRQREDD